MLDISYIYNAAKEIGEAIAQKTSWHTIAIRSTVSPGTSRKVGEIISKVSGKLIDKDFSVVSVPEFLREGTSVKDFFNPPMIVIGGESIQGIKHISQLFNGIDAPIFEVETKVAELIKFVSNSFHALKVSFANEVGSLCKIIGVDSHSLMEVFCEDKQLNISPYYFKPGFAYGGSCLPKDLEALRAMMQKYNVKAPIMASIEQSNRYHIERALQMIIQTGKRNILFLGLSFKEGTDDLRNSPAVELIERLVGKGCKVQIYDNNVSLSRLLGTNKKYIETKLPHIGKLLIDKLDQGIEASEVVVVAVKDSLYKEIILSIGDKPIIELVRLIPGKSDGMRQGLCW